MLFTQSVVDAPDRVPLLMRNPAIVFQPFVYDRDEIPQNGIALRFKIRQVFLIPVVFVRILFDGTVIVPGLPTDFGIALVFYFVQMLDKLFLCHFQHLSLSSP